MQDRRTVGDRVRSMFDEMLSRDRRSLGGDALEAADTVLQWQPDHRLAMFYRGTLKIRYKTDPSDAVDDWEKAFAGAPAGTSARVYETYRALVDICLEKLAQFTSIDPHNSTYHAAFGRACALFERLEQAERHLYRAVELDMNRWQDATRLAQMWSERGETEAAVQLLQKHLEIHAEEADLHHSLACLYHASNLQAQSLKHLETAAGLNPQHVASKRMLGDLYLVQGRFEQAEAQYNFVLTEAPSAAVYLGLAECFKNSYRFEEALQQYRKAIELEPRHFRALSDLGAMALQFGDLELGMSSLRKALEIEPGHVEVYSQLAKGALQKGDTLEAISAFRDVLKLDPKDAYACYSLATQLRAIGEFREASELLVRSMASRSGDVQVCLELADCYENLDRKGEAVELLREAYQRNPTHKDLRDVLARLAPVTSQNLFRATSTGPSLEDQINLGKAHLQAGRQEEAFESFRTALAASPDNPECMLQLSRLYASRGHVEPACDLLLRCYSRDKANFDLLLELFAILDKRTERERQVIIGRLAPLLSQDLQKVPWLAFLWEKRDQPGVDKNLLQLLGAVQKIFPPGHPIAKQWLDLQTA